MRAGSTSNCFAQTCSAPRPTPPNLRRWTVLRDRDLHIALGDHVLRLADELRRAA